MLTFPKSTIQKINQYSLSFTLPNVGLNWCCPRPDWKGTPWRHRSKAGLMGPWKHEKGDSDIVVQTLWS